MMELIISFEHSKFKNVISSVDSDVPLIHRNSEDKNLISLVSLVSAALTKRSKTLGAYQVPTIYFFCNLHRSNKNDSFIAPRRMMQALISELLQIQTLDEIPLTRDSIRRKSLRKTRGLGRLFRSLVASQPPESVMFLIIDSISEYKRIVDEEETTLLLKYLLGTLDEAAGTFKLLVTSRNTSRTLGKKLADEEVLLVPKDLVHGRRQGISNSQLAMMAQYTVGQISR